MINQHFENIFDAVKYGTIEDVRYCVENNNADVNINDEYYDGWTPLHWVAYVGNVEVAQLLVSSGANVDAKDDHGCTPLHLATEHERLGIVQLLVSCGADVNAKNQNRKTPLHCAAERNSNVEVLQYLVSQGADINTKNWRGKTPLLVAAECNSNVEVLQYLVSQGADVNVEIADGVTLVHLAAEHNSNVEVLQYLASQGADVNAESEYGWTPLHFAAGHNPNVDVLRYLVSQGADVNAKSEYGWTSLHYAAKSNSNVEVLQYLVSQSADVNAKNEDGKTPLDVANTEEKRAILQDAERKAGERMVLPVNGIEYPFRWCPAGTFMMGSPKSEEGRDSGETQHRVTLTKGFWMLETPVTQEMWESVTDANPSFYKDSSKLPVERVSWNDCQEFIQKLNVLIIAPTGYRFSLPTEAQWEYACRAGTTTPFNFGSTLNGDKANCNSNYHYDTTMKGCFLEKTSEVGSYPANAWGLYDVHGNVWEWCSDWWLDRYGEHSIDSVEDPEGASSGCSRVLRGGSWNSFAKCCRSAHRHWIDPSCRTDFVLPHWGSNIGFRLALVRVG